MAMVSYGFFKPINTLGVAVPMHQRWPLGDEGKQAKLFGGGAGPPPYPFVPPAGPTLFCANLPLKVAQSSFSSSPSQ